MGRRGERTRFLVCAARGEGVRAHQHGVVQRLAVVGVVALAGLWLKLRGVHRTPATSQGRSVRSVHGRAQAGRHDPPLSNSSLALTRAGPAVFLALREQMQGCVSGVIMSRSGCPGGELMAAGHALVIWVGEGGRRSLCCRSRAAADMLPILAADLLRFWPQTCCLILLQGGILPATGGEGKII